MIEFNCPNCDKHITVQDQNAGRTGICPQCQAKVTIPGAPAETKATNGGDTGRQKAVSSNTARNAAVTGNTTKQKAISGDTARNAAVTGNTTKQKAISGNTAKQKAISGNTSRNAAITGKHGAVTGKHGAVTSRNRAVAPTSHKGLMAKGNIVAAAVAAVVVISLGALYMTPKSAENTVAAAKVQKAAAPATETTTKSQPPKKEEQGKPSPKEATKPPQAKDAFPTTLDLPNGVKLQMVRINAGTFMMGNPTNATGASAPQGARQYKVTLTRDYWIGKHEVTQGQWQAVMGNNPSRFPKGNDYPVEQVSCRSAYEFCEKLNERYRSLLPPGYRFDLPTEAQWEYACRAGTATAIDNNQNLTAATDSNANLDEFGWYAKNSGQSPHPVGEKQPNVWGLYDMLGNVGEWCRGDGMQPNAQNAEFPRNSFMRPGIRGGSYRHAAQFCRAGQRFLPPPMPTSPNAPRGPFFLSGIDSAIDYVGFRLALVPVNPPPGAINVGQPPQQLASSQQYKFTYRVDGNGNAVLYRPSDGVPCVNPKPVGTLIVPESVNGHTITGIDAFAFENCDAMTRIVLPPRLEQLPISWGWVTYGNIFVGCKTLASIEIAATNPKFMSENGVLYSNDKKILYAYPKNRDDITLAKETTKIEGDAFNSCKFTTAKIPEGIDDFGAWVFSNCPNLETVEFPKTTKRIGHTLFSNLLNMKRVIFHGDAPEAITWLWRRQRHNVFSEAKEAVVVEVTKGSTGWAGANTTHLPARWPLDGSDSRPIRYLGAPGASDDDAFSGTLDLLNGMKLEMARIKAGTFTMGSPEDETGRADDEKQREVTLARDYWIGKYEVTQGQWRAVMMGRNPSFFKKGDDYPVEEVTWVEAKQFCDRLNMRFQRLLPPGYRFDLPTEAQWEYACRAGTTSALNDGQDLRIAMSSVVPLNALGWYHDNSDAATHSVGCKKPNAWDLYDMHGNVAEWCRDIYKNGPERVRRGGSWKGAAKFCRAACRNGYPPDSRNKCIGFRLALVPIE